ncbi:hypothetical protein V6N12_063746 [Hibiscus sabdariffa]|uniref:Uncharacterized protein n=1 Tax=Hibiscus sabdariffa TaxID=183260 RepID=A0ABR2AQ72_9ROSI
MAKRQRGTSSSSATENESSIKSLCFNEPGRQNLRSRFVTFFQTFPIRNERIPSIAAINDTNLKFKYLPHLKSWKFINTFKIPPHVYHVLVRKSGWELVGTEWKRKGKATVDNVDDVLQDVDDPVNLIRNEHLTDVAAN